MKKYELIPTEDKRFYRIKALREIYLSNRCYAPTDCAIVQKGDLGGLVESESNLSQRGDCWIEYDCKVVNLAEVSGNALIACHSFVGGSAKVTDNAVIHNSYVCQDAKVGGDAVVRGYAKIQGDAVVMDSSDYFTFNAIWRFGYVNTWTRSNDKYSCGCFYGDENAVKAHYAQRKDLRAYHCFDGMVAFIGLYVKPYCIDVEREDSGNDFGGYWRTLKEAFDE